MLKRALHKCASIYICHFKNLQDEQHMHIRQALDGSVDIILTEQPYNIRRHGAVPYSEHDKMTDEDIWNVRKFVAQRLFPGGHAVMFCSFLQFDWWHSLFRKKGVQKLEDSGVNMGRMEGGTSRSNAAGEEDIFGKDEEELQDDQATPGLKVENIPQLFVRVPDNYKGNPLRQTVDHTCVTETAIHLWRYEDGNTSHLSKDNYCDTGSSPSQFPSWTIVTNNMPRLKANDVVYAL